MGTSYTIAKTAVNGLTAKLAHEESDTGVLINAVCPGFTATFEGGEALGLDLYRRVLPASYGLPC
ncbi:hypothetical protein GCM10028805_17900 [Spirosoma harenae]